MRVLYVTAHASAVGGIEANVLDSARALRARGHAVALVHSDGDADERFREVFPVRFRLGSAPGASLRRGTAAESLHRAVTAFRADLVYLHKIEDASQLALDRLSVPAVRMVHDHDLYCQRRHRYLPRSLEVCSRPAHALGCLRCGGFIERRRGSLLGVGLRTIQGRLRDLAATRTLTRILVASDAMAAELRLNGIPDELVRTVPLGVPDIAVPPRRAPGPTGLLYVGQVLRTKGLDLLLRALGELPDATLTVVGDGPQRPEFQELAGELGLTDRVDWRGRVSPQEVAETMAAADAVVVPSRWPEPFGLVGLEGMRAGLPVVAFDVGGVRQWLTDGETGLVVPPADPAALAEALARVCRSPELRERLGDAARARFEEQFTMERYIDRLERALTSVVTGDGEATCA